MSQRLALAVVAGLVSGGLYLSLSGVGGGLLLLSYFVQLPLMFVGLTMGLNSVIIAAGSAGIVGIAIAGWVAGLAFIFVEAVPVLLVLRQALLSRAGAGGQMEWYPPGPLLGQLTVLAALGMVAVTAAFIGQEGGLPGAVEVFLTEFVREIGLVGNDTDLAPLVGYWSRIVPAMVAISWIVMVVINGIIAQIAAVRLGWNLRATPRLIDITLPRWCLIAVFACATASLITGDGTIGFLAHSLLIVFLVPHFFQGLAVVHAFAGRTGARRMALAIFYLCLLVFSWPLAGLVVVLGFIEDWAHLRRRFV
jgi:uncharacterized protein YybS (DUF2232 family)